MLPVHTHSNGTARFEMVCEALNAMGTSERASEGARETEIMKLIVALHTTYEM
jgi:hypothetical protein